jgi:hypothetical protein
MTVQHDPTGTASTVPAGSEQSAGSGKAETAKNEATAVASTAAGGAREVAEEAGAQAKAVAGEAKQQLDRLIGQSRDEVRREAETRTTQVAGQLRTLSEQVGALLDGRPQAAGPLVGYAGDLQGQLRRFAARMEQGGAQGVVDDVTRFARRRPGVFLAGAAGMGFVVGRLVRAGAASQRTDATDQPSSSVDLATPNGPGYEDRGELPPPLRSAGLAP